MKKPDRDQRLCGMVWSEQVLREVLSRLSSIGPRLIGSAGEAHAQEYIAGLLRSFGLETGFREFEVETYRRGFARAAVSCRGRVTDLPCLGFVYSASTNGPLKLEVRDVGEGPAEPDGEPARDLGGLAAYCRPGDEMRSRKYRSLIDRGAAACVFASHVRHHDACIISVARPTEKNPRVPAIGLNMTGSGIMSEAAAAGGAEITIEVAGATDASKSGNVSAVIHGRTELPEIIVGAHLDTYDISEGAMDNGAGVALVVQLAGILSAMPAPERTVRFALFTGEETGCVGSARYVADEVADPSRVGLYFNVDMPAEGGVPGILYSEGFPADAYFPPEFERIDHKFPVGRMPGRYSDHAAFVQKGIPAMWLRTFSPGVRGPAAQEHTVLDTADKVDMLELKESCLLAGRLLLRLADSRTWPFEMAGCKAG